jgi:pilus assembly protein FimV
MNGSLKLTLAVALALGSTNALALGLGMIQVKSGLNEPLVAEIPVTGGPDETASVSVALAAASDFERVGLSRSRILVPLEFVVATGAKGNAVIKVTTKEPVRDPFLDFLIEVNWAKGKLLREYTVLLDPPTMAPAIKGSRASTAPVRDGATPAASAQLPSAKPSKPSGKPARTTDTAAAPAATPEPSAPRSAAAGEYGPVASGETLWEVAAATRPDEGVSLNQVMVALLRANPNAFYRDNINSLKRGAILRVPSADEIRAAGSAAAAAAEVRSQNDAARGGAAAPTLVADSGTTPSRPSSGASAGTSTTKPSDRLELVPPKTGKDASASAERPGAGGTGDSTVRAELARTKEALASSNQEASELKSRVRELEELKTKNDKLLTLKDSELAALQQKLKELQDKAAAKPVATTAPPPAATTSPATSTPPAASTTVTAKPGDKSGAITKEEIWGATTPPSGTTSTTAPSTTPSATTTPPASTATTPPAATTTPSTTTSATPGATTPSTTPPATVTTPPAATPSTSPGTTTETTPSTTSTTPPATTPSTTTAPSTAPTTTPPATTTPAKPATSTTAPAKPSTPGKVQPLPAAKPWYAQPTTWMYGLGGLAVLGALGFLASRVLGKKKAPAAAAGGAAYAETTSPLQDEEDALLDRLAQYPDDTSAHLELTSLYYSQGDADKFEAAAQAMYAHIYDTNMPEWQQVQAMGRELVPSNPLFAEPLASAPAFGSYQETSPEPMRFDGFDDGGFGSPPPARAASADDDAFDFDLADRNAPPPAPAARDDFSFDLTPPPAQTPPPPSNYQTQVQPLPPIPDLAPPPSRVDDDLLASDDAIGTKLDLAKAYLDMGDPDGARSMLEEVLIEGSDTQKNEARKLLAEIR